MCSFPGIFVQELFIVRIPHLPTSIYVYSLLFFFFCLLSPLCFRCLATDPYSPTTLMTLKTIYLTDHLYTRQTELERICRTQRLEENESFQRIDLNRELGKYKVLFCVPSSSFPSRRTPCLLTRPLIFDIILSLSLSHPPPSF
jgi:hypothetical protein